MKTSTIWIVAAALSGVPGLAWASGCTDEVVARIAFPPGGLCWAYRGKATTFVGTFAAHQRVIAAMRGIASEYDPKSGAVVSHMANRTPDVSGPGFHQEGDMGRPTLSILTPRAGVYRFGFSPCAMWGAPGEIRICAR